ncbi:M36 family metallopeptidase [Streptomyces sp. NBC_00572]|uniref:M36 family metallopeptidase n=1 Tax=Streptomyces sp. NBC_00572 TaxID=2903664 RepID=UPI0022523131|nr:M36 family metallopeptidase [Streptomyces sp. NBC_00572]MCX4984751.1 M36 family metallopeptidase [Streptomyces sp. NBC_00572]
MPPTRLSTRARTLLIGAVLLALPAVTTTPSAAVIGAAERPGEQKRPAQEQPDLPYPNIDVRGDKRVTPTAGQLRAAQELDGAAIRWGRFGTPRLLTPQGRNALTATSATDPQSLALDHIREHAALYGLSAAELDALTVVTSYRTEHNGVRHVFIGQSDRGVPVHGARLSVAVDASGRILTVTGSLVAEARATGTAVLGKAAALDRAAASVGTDSPSGAPSHSPSGATTATATRVTFPLADGTARPAWRTTLTADNKHLYDIVVDAGNGTVLQRTDLTSNEGPEGRVFTGQNPTLGSAATVPFSGLGRSWVTGRVTTGNNGEVSQDLDGVETLGHQPQTPAAGDPAYQHFAYTFTDAFRTSGGTDLTTDRDAVVTQAFYYANRMHDHLYGLGFDEASGNFQEDNLGNGGAGGDRVQVYVDFDANGDSACNANFGTPADGQNPTMRLFVGRASCDNHNVHRAMNGDTVAHEYSHGLSHRLVGGGDMGDGVQTGALGEGWSDAVATSLWNDPVYGEYNNGRPTGIRRVAYDNSHLTYADLCDDGTCSVHSDGEIWATTMWDMRTALVGAYGYTTGKQRHEQLMVDGMKQTPSSPDFLDARDGILAADRANHGGANQCLLWGVFARRGMGASATSPSQGQANPATDHPASCRPTADAGGPYTTKEGSDVRLDAGGSTVPGGGGSYSWDFDGDGAYDDATGVSPLFDRVGQDGTYTVGLRVGNAAGADTDTATVTVTNVAPTVNLTVQGPREEGGRLTVSGTVTDPGWLDPLTATIDPGDGKPVALPGQLENNRPDATLTFSREIAFGDNGTFTVKICGSDDDTSTCREADVTVANVDPTIALDKTGAVPLAGGRTLVVRAGEEKRYTARITDPGSDDETMSWAWGDGTPPTTTTSLVNPPGTDPARSPSVQPRDLTDAPAHTYTKPCLYNLSLTARDDDGGTGTDGTPLIVQGHAPLSLLADVWYVKYLTGDLTGLGKETLDCYLKIVQHSSAVFSEKVDVSTQGKAANVLFLNLLMDPKRSLDRQLLAAWLNFANGAFDPYELVDTDSDLKADTPFLEAVQNAEKVRLDPQATKQQLSAQAAILTCINIPLV